MDISKQKLIHSMKHYVSGLILIWAAILFYRYNSYYSGLLRTETQATLLFLALAYTFIGLAFYVFIPVEKTPKSKGLTLFRAFRRIIKELII